MAFLDNSGDIILDAVLTDTGRFRLAKGDGSFKIAKFAFGDDEINYENYDKDHASGSAYYDLEILQTPVLEAFTNNMSSMKSKLVSIPRTNLLYLPVLKLQDKQSTTKKYDIGAAYDTFLVAVDEDTEKHGSGTGETWQSGFTNVGSTDGILKGNTVGGEGNSFIEVHQGLDTSDISPSFKLDGDLVENQYILEIDNRLGSIIDTNGAKALVSYIDDDNIASYYLSTTSNNNFVSTNTETLPVGETGAGNQQTITGPRGTILKFAIQAGLDLNTGTTLFTKLGSTFTLNSTCFYYIDTTVRVTGATTGYRLDVPVRFIKRKSTSAC